MLLLQHSLSLKWVLSSLASGPFPSSRSFLLHFSICSWHGKTPLSPAVLDLWYWEQNELESGAWAFKRLSLIFAGNFEFFIWVLALYIKKSILLSDNLNSSNLLYFMACLWVWRDFIVSFSSLACPCPTTIVSTNSVWNPLKGFCFGRNTFKLLYTNISM